MKKTMTSLCESIWLILAAAAITNPTTSILVHAHRHCQEDGARRSNHNVVMISASADTREDLTASMEAFRTLLSGVNGEHTRSDHHPRHIRWDDDATVPFYMPGDFLAQTQGLVVTTRNISDNAFVVSNPKSGNGTTALDHAAFDSSAVGDEKQQEEAVQEQFSMSHYFRSTASDEARRSTKRFFSPLYDNEIYVNFMNPRGDHSHITPALVTGFGAVFLNVGDESSAATITTMVQFLDHLGCPLKEEVNVPLEASSSNSGIWSFLGVYFGSTPTVATVKITLGDRVIGKLAAASSSMREQDNGGVVVMEDFLYGEPQTL